MFFHPFLFGDNLDNIYRNMNCCHCQCIWMNLKWCEYFERWNFCRRSVIRTWCFLWASCWGISECDICHFKFAGFFFSICYRFYIVHSIFFNDTCGRWFVNSCKVYFEKSNSPSADEKLGASPLDIIFNFNVFSVGPIW